jgi:hypothetical protein
LVLLNELVRRAPVTAAAAAATAADAECAGVLGFRATGALATGVLRVLPSVDMG